MAKYITLYQTTEELESDKINISYPNVSYIEEGDTVLYNPGLEVVTTYTITDTENPTRIRYQPNDASTPIARQILIDGVKLPDVPTHYTFSTTGEHTVTYRFDLKKIPTVAFGVCSAMTAVTIPNKTTEIGTLAFEGCTGLTTITIPASVRTLGNRAFYGCTNLLTVNVEFKNTRRSNLFSGLDTVGSNAFYNCNGLTKVNIQTTDTYNNAVGSLGFTWGGILFLNYNGNPLSKAKHLYINDTEVTELCICKTVSGGGNITFVPVIGDYAFYNCESFSTITIGISGEDITIGTLAFYYCTGALTVKVKKLLGSFNKVSSVNLDNSYVKELGNSVFGSNTVLTTVTGGSALTSIGGSAFKNCTNLTSLPNFSRLETVGNSAFLGCNKLTSFVANSLKLVDNYAFKDCTSLTSIQGNSNSNIVIGNYAFSGCTSLRTINYFRGKTIGQYAFLGCTSLNNIWGTSSILSTNNSYPTESIGMRAFSGCTGITTLYVVLGLKTVSSYAFENCTGLVNLVFYNNSNLLLQERVFQNCNSLTNIVFDNVGAISFSYECFISCSSIAHVYTKSIAKWCNIDFYYNSGLTAITHLLETCTGYSYSSYSGQFTISGAQTIVNLVIPGTITRVGNYSFYQCTSLETITIELGVTTISSYSFSGCTNLVTTTLAPSVKYIGYGAFEDCTGEIAIGGVLTLEYDEEPYGVLNGSAFTSAVITDAVTTLDIHTFMDSTITSLTIGTGLMTLHNTGGLPPTVTSISVSAQNPNYDSRNNCNAIIETSANKLIVGCKNSTIPNTITTIDNNAFGGCSGLTSVTIPNSVTSIGSYAFYYCDSLTAVNITDLAAWCNISFGDREANPLMYAHHLYLNGTEVTSVTLPSGIIEVGVHFTGCTELTSITIPEGVTQIVQDAFNGCTSLSLVTLPSTLTTLGYRCFENSGLTSITIPNGVTRIQGFKNCSNLVTVSMGNSVTHIYEIKGCTSLTTINIPDSVTSIGYGAFYGDDALPTETRNKILSINAYAFESDDYED